MHERKAANEKQNQFAEHKKRNAENGGSHKLVKKENVNFTTAEKTTNVYKAKKRKKASSGLCSLLPSKRGTGLMCMQRRRHSNKNKERRGGSVMNSNVNKAFTVPWIKGKQDSAQQRHWRPTQQRTEKGPLLSLFCLLKLLQIRVSVRVSSLLAVRLLGER